MESKFTGGLLGLIGVTIVSILICVFTLFIGLPFAVCYEQRWIAKHTVIEGKQLVFDGTGIQLWGKYIIWFLLSIITLGIYSLWMGINMRKWIVSHTHFVDSATAQLPA